LLPTNHTQDVITLTENENRDGNNTSEQENDIEESNNPTNDNHENDEESRVRRSSRRIQPSSKLRDFVSYKVTYPIQNFISYDQISAKHKAFLTSLSHQEEPKHFQEALSQPVWCETMKEELRALEKNNT
jgi:hypothetical protein